MRLFLFSNTVIWFCPFVHSKLRSQWIFICVCFVLSRNKLTRFLLGSMQTETVDSVTPNSEKWWTNDEEKLDNCHLIKQLGSFLTHYICLLLTLEFWLKTKHKVLSNQSISSLRWIAPRKLYSKAWMFDMDHWCWR